ncbi:hypothetical protein NTGZN8_260010 [Candidatus Nitrotoga fabula]|uniref:Uncharacterized protein n=1 Tax=Candidatus Nitrotoga fabula TaxID=2182327 RepID=A0A916F8Z4_9PROT|nr:hypothetical protein NTGZN8_260010 [Candidatus Nitrotoga fabula]
MDGRGQQTRCLVPAGLCIQRRTAPKHPSQFDPTNSYSASGWIIAAGYNSFRSGGDYYNPGKEPMCLSGSGWYTFKQVFKDVGGQLVVDYFILDSSGVPAQCTDYLGVPGPCQWTRTPGHAIADVGCPRYGWLANEEINDLPIDNTKLFANGCGIASEGRITPTNTSCQMYADGTASTLEELTYTMLRKDPESTTYTFSTNGFNSAAIDMIKRP